MSMLDTMHNRKLPVAETLRAALGQLAMDPTVDPWTGLFSPDTS